MSGGHFDGQEWSISFKLENIANDKSFKKDCPQLSNVLLLLSSKLKEIISEYDYYISGDKNIENIKSFEIVSINALRDATFERD